MPKRKKVISFWEIKLLSEKLTTDRQTSDNSELDKLRCYFFGTELGPGSLGLIPDEPGQLCPEESLSLT